MKKLFIFGSSLLFTFLLFYFRNSSSHHKEYYDTIQITDFNYAGAPCAPVLINDIPLTLLFDSGFYGHFSIKPSVIETIKDKTYIKTENYFGFRGKSYESKKYLIPQAEIGNYIFTNLEIKEQISQYLKDGKLKINESSDSHQETQEHIGKFGWTLFKSLNLLIDIPNNQLGAADGIETLLKENHFSNGYVTAPLLHNKPYLGILLFTPKGMLKCCIDTGATINVINHSVEGETICLPLAFVSGQNFGPLDFYSVPIHIIEAPDAVLGMDFLSQHTIFIDFKKNTVYISN